MLSMRGTSVGHDNDDVLQQAFCLDCQLGEITLKEKSNKKPPAQRLLCDSHEHC